MEQLNLVKKLSLTDMTLRTVVVNLWYECDISAAVLIPSDTPLYLYKVKSEIIDAVKGKISNLAVPESLKERMVDLIKPIRTEIQDWKMDHELILDDVPPEAFDMRILKQLCWTCAGTVDYRKTAEKLVCLDILSIEMRYRLACWNCLEDLVPALWAELPEKFKRRFEDEVNPIPETANHLMSYWTSLLQGKDLQLDHVLPAEFTDKSPTYLNFFNYSVYLCSKAAIEYFFQKLTDEERGTALFRTACVALVELTNLKPDIFCYLLSLMTREQQMQVFKSHPSRCLTFFLEWPLQDLFSDIADLTWNFLPESQYDYVMDKTFVSMFYFHTAHYFPELFQKFFMRSPINFRRHFVDRTGQYNCVHFLRSFIHANDTATIRVVLNYCDRMRLLSKREFLGFMSDFVESGQWYAVELFLRRDTLSQEDRQTLQEVYSAYQIETRRLYPDYDVRQPRWLQFYELLRETGAVTLCSTDPDDDHSIKLKRVCVVSEWCDSTKRFKKTTKTITFSR